MKKGYVIAIRNKLTDPQEMAIYTEKVGPTFPASWRPLVAYGAQDAVEGPAIEGLVIIEFDSYAAAKEWYESPGYADARAHRLKGADYHFIIAEGI